MDDRDEPMADEQPVKGDRTVTSPPPGRWEISPRELISGADVRIELWYRNGEAELAPGAWFRMDIEPISVKATLFCPMSDGMEIHPIDGPVPDVVVEQQPQTPVGYRPVRLTLPNGMQPGEGFALRIGNRTEGGDLLGLVMPSPVENLAFNVWSGDGSIDGEVDWFEMGWASVLPRCSIRAAPASALRIFAPSLVQSGTPFSVRLAVTDPYDSAAHPSFEGEVGFSQGPHGLPDTIRLSAADGCSTTVDGIVINEAGVHRITAFLDGQAFESNPIVVRDRVDAPIYWGLVHGHDWHSECWGDGPDNYYRFGRTISGLDYLGLSDHINTKPRSDNFIGRLHPYRTGEKVSARDAFLENVRAANERYEPGSFVTLIGYEMSPPTTLHHNIFWAEADAGNFERIFLDADAVYAEATEANLRDTNALIVPHMHARYVPYNHLALGTNELGEPLAPVVEGYSDWGMAFHPPGEQDALIGGLTHPSARGFYEWVGRGIHVGFVGDSDTHSGLPGRRHAGSPSPPPHHYCPQGITAVRAGELTRQGIIDAYRSRWTYGTSGQRIFLDVRAGDSRMGGTFDAGNEFTLTVEVAGTEVIERVGLYAPDGLVEERVLGSVRETTLEFSLASPTRPDVPYFVEVVQVDHHRAWSSPIWVRNTSLPDLSWGLGDDGTLRLTNVGGSVARDVTVAHSDRQHPFALPPVRYPHKEPAPPCAMVWTHRWDDHRVTVFMLWRGVGLSGAVILDGFERYDLEMETIQLGRSPIDDDGNGRLGFATPTAGAGSRQTWGFNTTVHISHSRPAIARIELDVEATVHVGDDTLRTRVVTLPLNGLSEPVDIVRMSVGDIAPGEVWSAPSPTGMWSADPDNEIVQGSETTRLHAAGASTSRSA